MIGSWVRASLSKEKPHLPNFGVIYSELGNTGAGAVSPHSDFLNLATELTSCSRTNNLQNKAKISPCMTHEKIWAQLVISFLESVFLRIAHTSQKKSSLFLEILMESMTLIHKVMGIVGENVKLYHKDGQ